MTADFALAQTAVKEAALQQSLSSAACMSMSQSVILDTINGFLTDSEHQIRKSRESEHECT